MEALRAEDMRAMCRFVREIHAITHRIAAWYSRSPIEPAKLKPVGSADFSGNEDIERTEVYQIELGAPAAPDTAGFSS